jgi:methyl-accepting chemotaxis protein
VSVLFHPAGMLVGRLRYAWKIVLVAVVLMLPLGFVAWGYIDIQRGQVAFSTAERHGLGYLKPLQELTAQTVAARNMAVTGQDVAHASLDEAVANVDATDQIYGERFETTPAWTAVRQALGQTRSARNPADALQAYDKATSLLLSLIVQVSDKSNLTLDPDLDTYYIMDALMFRLPILLDASGHAIDTAIVYANGTPEQVDAARIDLAIASGTLTATTNAVEAGMTTGMSNTASATFTATRPKVEAMLDALEALLAQITRGVQTGDLASLGADSADASMTAAADLARTLAPIEDHLIAVRVQRFEAKALWVITGTAITVLLVGYLLVGFYRSATLPLRRMVTALESLAEGDLTGQVPVETRDEVGKMASALNEALARVRTSIDELRDSAAGVADSSSEMTNVSQQLRSAAHNTTTRSGAVGDAAAEVRSNVDTVASGTEEMTAAIGEIASGATEAVTVAGQAVAAARSSNDAVSRLGQSSAEIGDVVKVITSIAEQINLLALNATIEAARAGDAGRGFAVVAHEVKELSLETARATGDITSRVQTIQTDAADAVQAIGHIGAVIGRINEIQTSIASAVEEQNATTAEMARNIAGLASGTADIVHGLTDVIDSAGNTEISAVTTERAADQLARTASDLRAIVRRFRTAAER